MRLDDVVGRIDGKIDVLRLELTAFVRDVLSGAQTAELRRTLARELRDELTGVLGAAHAKLSTEVDLKSEASRRTVDAFDGSLRELTRRSADFEERIGDLAGRVAEEHLTARITAVAQRMVDALLAPEVQRRLEELTEAYEGFDEQQSRIREYIESFGPGGLPVAKQAKEAAERRVSELEKSLDLKDEELRRLRTEINDRHEESLRHRLTRDVDLALLTKRVEEFDERERDLADRLALDSECKRLQRRIEELQAQNDRWTEDASRSRREEVDYNRLARLEEEASETARELERRQLAFDRLKRENREIRTRAEQVEARLREVQKFETSMQEHEVLRGTLQSEVHELHSLRARDEAMASELRSDLARSDLRATDLERRLQSLETSLATQLNQARREGTEEARASLQKWAEDHAARLQAAVIADLASARTDLENGRKQIATLERLNLDQRRATMELEAAKRRLELQLAEAEAHRLELLASYEERIESERNLVLASATTDAKLELQRLEVAREAEQSKMIRMEGAVGELRSREHALQESVSELASRKGAIEGELEVMRARLDETRAKDVPDEVRMASLEQPIVRPKYLEERTHKLAEVEWLSALNHRIKDTGFTFHSRLLRAFHTSLKIANEAPITILSGISGTGKSELPRLYSDLGGLSFIELPVQPSWDSPQDLLGFFSYTDSRVKAEPLARLLRQMSTDNGGIGSRPALVLLDEMNLARVEYYFAEFLSKLEARRAWLRKPEGPEKEEARERASVSIDAGPGRPSIPLFLDPRVLFVGTMNEDESTLAISPKVLDRACVLNFPAPREMRMTVQSGTGSSALPVSWATWTSWQRGGADAADENVSIRLNAINSVMADVGRPFGHRLFRAIHAYIVNYPAVDSTGGIDDALADQFAMKIMPRLKGLECHEGRVRQALDDLRRYVPEVLHASYDDARRGDFFDWTGAAELYRVET